MYAMYYVAIGSLAALAFAACMFFRVKKEPGGSKEMLGISSAVQKGANAYLRRQYKGVGIFFAVVFVILMGMAICGFLSFFTPFAFLTGGFFSGLSGFIGMRTATMANCRTAQGASESLNKGLRVAFSAGSVMGFTVVGLGLFDLTVWYFILNMAFGALPEGERIAQITANMLTFGMGASSMALFARVGGGIFTKAADVGADLVGKVEAGIPEDDPRNPAVIADNVGDNVGDVAGMGADLYESYVGSIVSTSALAVAAGYGVKGVAVPMMLAALGVIASIAGTFFVNTKEDATQKNLLTALRTGTYISAVLVVLAACVTFAVLIFLIAYILIRGVPYLTPELFSLHYTSDNVSLMPALFNTIEMIFLALILAVPVGIFSAIYLVEYAKKGNKFVGVVRVTAETLSGIPSIVYGLFGMLFFVTKLKWSYSMLAGAFTLAIMILPLIMRTTEEALISVPDSYREGSFGLGAGKLRTVFQVVLPSAIPGILAGVILGIGRIVGETAALMYTSGTVAKYAGAMESGRTLALHMYVLTSEALHVDQASATAVVLLIIVIGINAFSGFIAKKLAKKTGEE